MTFVSPWLLLGISAIIIPIALHLLLNRQPRKLIFPALKFLKQVKESNRRSMNLRHLLLLLCRIGLIVLLALLFARPSLQKNVSGSLSSPTSAVLIFDTSIRMNCRQNNESILDSARQNGFWVLSRLPSGSQIAVLDSQTQTAAFAVDRSAAKYRIEQLKTAPKTQELTAQIIKAAQLLNGSELGGKEIYVFTDMSAAVWNKTFAAAVVSSLKSNKNPQLYIIDVGMKQPTNDSLSNLTLNHQILAPGDSLTISATVNRTAAQSIVPAPRTAQLYICDEKGVFQKREEKIIDSSEISGGSSGSSSTDVSGSSSGKSSGSSSNKPAVNSHRLTFTVSGFQPGIYQGFVKLSGTDALPDDDYRWFTFECKNSENILLIAPAPAEKNSVYVYQALCPKAFKSNNKNRYNCTVIDQEVFDSDSFPAEKLNDFKAAMLLNPRPFSAAGWSKLQLWTQAGNGLAIVLGSNVSDVNSFNSPQAQELLPGKLEIQARTPQGDVFVLPRSFIHPILTPFGKYENKTPWTSIPVFRYWQMSNFSDSVNVILRFSDLRPFMIERTLGAGRTITLTTPWGETSSEKAWNAFSSSQSWPIFILINQTANYLLQNNYSKLNYLTGENAYIDVESNNNYQITVSRMETEESEIKTAKSDTSQLDNLIHPTSVNGKLALIIPSTGSAGNLMLESQGDKTLDKRGVSFNYPESETDISRIDAGELKTFFGDYPYSAHRDRLQIEHSVSSGRTGKELFPLLAFLFCVLLGFESWLSDRFYKNNA